MSDLDYSSIITGSDEDEEDTLVTPADNPMDYSAIVAEQTQKDNAAFRASMLDAANTQPDQHAKVIDLAKRAGVPVSAVEVDPKEANRQATEVTTDFSHLTKRYPYTTRFLTDKDNAKLASDDVKNLEHLEDVFRGNFGALGGSIPSSTPVINPALITSQEDREETYGEAITKGWRQGQGTNDYGELMYLVAHGGYAALSPEQRKRLEEVSPYQTVEFGVEEEQRYAEKRGWTGSDVLFSTANLAAMMKSSVWNVGALSKAITGATGGMVLGAAGGPGGSAVLGTTGFIAGLTAGMTEHAYRVEFGHAYGEFKDFPNIDPDNAKYAAAAVGTINALIEVAGFNFAMIKPLKSAVMAAFKRGMTDPRFLVNLGRFGARYGTAAGWETLTEQVQEIAPWFFGEIERASAVGEEPRFDIDELLSRMAQVGEETLKGMIVLGGVSPAGQFAIETTKAVRAQQDKAILDQIYGNVHSSKLRNRSAERFQGFLQSVIEGSGETGEVFIDLARASTYLRDQGLPPSEFFKGLVDESELARGFAIGGDVKVDLDALLTHLSQREDADIARENIAGVLGHVRRNDDGMTFAESETIGEQHKAEAEAYLATLDATEREMQMVEKPLDLIAEMAAEQAIQGGYDTAGAQAYGELIRARMGTALEDFSGDPDFDILEFWRGWGIDVRMERTGQLDLTDAELTGIEDDVEALRTGELERLLAEAEQAPDTTARIEQLQKVNTALTELDVDLEQVSNEEVRSILEAATTPEPAGGTLIVDQEGTPGARFGRSLEQWQARVARVRHREIDTGIDVSLGRVPPVLKEMGFEEIGLNMLSGKIGKAMREHPTVPDTVWDELPALIADPLYAYYQPGDNPAIVVVLDARTTDDKPIFAIVTPEGKTQHDVATNYVLSVYPREPNDSMSPDERIIAAITSARERGENVYTREPPSTPSWGLDPADFKRIREVQSSPRVQDRHPRRGQKKKLITRETVVNKFRGVFFQDEMDGQPGYLGDPFPVPTGDMTVPEVSRLADGRYHGAPGGKPMAPAQVNSLVTRLVRLAKHELALGEKSRTFYESGGRMMVALTQGDEKQLESLIRVTAVMSADTGLGTNTAAVIDFAYKYVTGQELETGFGRYPKANLRTLLEALEADVFDKRIYGVSDKVMSFYRNLKDGATGENRWAGESTLDVHMFRLFGYTGGSKRFIGPQYGFGRMVIHKVARRLSKDFGVEILPRQAQAMLWAYQRNSVKPPAKANALGYEDYFDRHAAAITWEANPSVRSGLFPEIMSQPPAVQRQFADEAWALIKDEETGRNLLLDKLGIPLYVEAPGVGTFEGEVSPNVVTFMVLPRTKSFPAVGTIQPKVWQKAGKYGPLTKAEARTADHYMADTVSNLLGYIYQQDAVPYHRPDWTLNKKDSNAGISFAVPAGQVDPTDLYDHVRAAVPAAEFSMVPRPSEGTVEFRFINFANVKEKVYIDSILAALRSFPSGPVKAEIVGFRSTGNYLTNDWNSYGGRHGGDYLARLGEKERSDLSEWAGDRRQAFLELTRDFKDRLEKGGFFPPVEAESTEGVAFFQGGTDRILQDKIARDREGPNVKPERRGPENFADVPGFWNPVWRIVADMNIPAWKKPDGRASGKDIFDKLKASAFPPGSDRKNAFKWTGIEDFLMSEPMSHYNRHEVLTFVEQGLDETEEAFPIVEVLAGGTVEADAPPPAHITPVGSPIQETWSEQDAVEVLSWHGHNNVPPSALDYRSGVERTIEHYSNAFRNIYLGEAYDQTAEDQLYFPGTGPGLTDSERERRASIPARYQPRTDEWSAESMFEAPIPVPVLAERVRDTLLHEILPLNNQQIMWKAYSDIHGEKPTPEMDMASGFTPDLFVGTQLTEAEAVRFRRFDWERKQDAWMIAQLLDAETYEIFGPAGITFDELVDRATEHTARWDYTNNTDDAYWRADLPGGTDAVDIYNFETGPMALDSDGGRYFVVAPDGGEAEFVEMADVELYVSALAAGVHADEASSMTAEELAQQNVPEAQRPRWRQHVTPGEFTNYRERKLTLPEMEETYTQGGPLQHFPDRNLLVFTRETDRTWEELRDDFGEQFHDGAKVFELGEIQSDWHQEGRQRGYKIRGAPDPATISSIDKLLGEKQRLVFYDLENAANRGHHSRETDDYVKLTWNHFRGFVEAFNNSLRTLSERGGRQTFGYYSGQLPGELGPDKMEYAVFASEVIVGLSKSGDTGRLYRAALDNVIHLASKGPVIGLTAQLSAVAGMLPETFDATAVEEAFDKTIPNFDTEGLSLATQTNAGMTRFSNWYHGRENSPVRNPNWYHGRTGGRTPQEGPPPQYPLEAFVEHILLRAKIRRLQKAMTFSIPQAPFSGDAWIALGAKRALMAAALDETYDVFAWPNSVELVRRWSGASRTLYENTYDKKLPSIVKKLTGQKPQFVKFSDTYSEGVPFGAVGESVTSAMRAGHYTPNQGWHYIHLTPELREEIKSAGFSFYQDEETGPRGKIRFQPGRTTISLFRNSDMSTLLHETGHLFLEMEAELATRPGAPERVKQRYAEVLKWLDATSADDLNPDIAGEAAIARHEKFARAFEQYLMEGKAPTEALRGSFARFKAWLLNIYRRILRIDTVEEIDDSIRSVFDRMLATDAQILETEDAANLKPHPEIMALMTDDERQAALDAARRARDDATIEIELEQIRHINRQNEAWWSKEKKAIAVEVRAELDAQPVYRAWRLVTKGIDDLERTPMDRAAVEELLGENAQRLPKSVPPMTIKEGGAHPDEVAALVGFDSGAQMLDALINMTKYSDAVNQRVDQEMTDRHGDPTAEGALATEAMEAVHNDQRALFLNTELRALARKAGQPPQQLQVIREAVTRIVSETPVGEVLKPFRYMQQAQRASRAVDKALLAEDFNEAYTKKREQLYAHEMFRETLKARDKVEKIRTRLNKRRNKKINPNTIDPEYVGKIKDLLATYEFGGKSVERTRGDLAATALAFIERRQAAGVPITLPTDLVEIDGLDEQGQPILRMKVLHWREMTLDELTGLDDVVKSLWKAGRANSKENKQAFADDMTALADGIYARKKVRKGTTKVFARDTKLRRAGKLARQWFAELRKFESLVRELDGHKDVGPIHQAMFMPLAEAAGKESDMIKKAYADLDKIFNRYTAGERARWGRTAMGSGIYVPEVNDTMTKDNMLSIALNWGNEGNRQALMEGYGWSEPQVVAILAKLTDKDWDTVEMLWDYIDSYWSQIKEVQERLTGVAPPKVEADPFVTPDGRQMKGGYYPLKYDPDQDTRTSRNLVDEQSQQLISGGWGSANTKHGFTIARVGSAGQKVKLTLSVLHTHLNEVIHDITHREAVIGVDKMLRNKPFSQAIVDTVGKEAYDALQAMLKFVAAGRIESLSGIERVFQHLRVGIVATEMGFNIRTMLTQPMGMTQSIARIGTVAMGRGIVRFYGRPSHMIDMVEFMHERSPALRDRAVIFQREIAEQFDALQKTSRMDTAQKAAFWGIVKMDVYAVAYPTWIGAYETKMKETRNEEVAIAYADSVVRLTQGAGNRLNLSVVQQKNELHKWLTLFYSYFNVMHNMMAEAYQKTDFRKPGDIAKYLGEFAMLSIIPGALSALVLENWPEDDDEEEWVKFMLIQMVNYTSGGMPVVRDVVSGITSPFGYSLTPVGRVGELVTKTAKSLPKAIEDGELDDYMIKNSARMLAYMFQIPGVGQILRSGGYLADLLEGDLKRDPSVKGLSITGNR